MEGFHGVRAGEDEPIVRSKTGKGCVECRKRSGWNDFDGGDKDRYGSERFELSG